MTKEKLINRILQEFLSPSDAEGTFIVNIIENFFDSNVCIPKGVLRHPYADVYHQYLEDITQELEYKYNNVWLSSAFNREDHSVELRIKPTEPVYEWQWLHMSKQSNCARGLTNDWFTEEEASIDPVYQWVKIEETKRIRA